MTRNYTDADLMRGRKISRSQDWTGRIREKIAVAIAEERAAMREEMTARVARSEGEMQKTIETFKRIWNIK